MRAKSHDQRKGQWLYNKIRIKPDMPDCKSEMDLLLHKARLADIIWNMENDEFDKLMAEYDK